MKNEVKVKENHGEDESSPEVAQQIHLKSGGYMLHVYIEEARSLVPPNNSETCDAVFAITSFGITKTTKEFKDVSAISTPKVFEHLYIDIKGKTPEEIQSERLTITVKDNSLLNFHRNIIGTHEIDLTFIYSSDCHGLVHRWIVISNAEDNKFGAMKGYVKIGVSLLHESDRPVDLAVKETACFQDKDLLMPAHINTKVFQLKIQLLKADNLPKMDSGSTVDAFCIARFASIECQSSVVTADKINFSVYWLDEILIPVLTPSVASTVALTIWDRDILSKNDLVSGITLNFNSVLRGDLKEFFWANLYGAPQMAEGEAAEYMNRVSAAASHWRGRILLRAWVEEDVKETYKKCVKISDPKIKELITDKFECGDDFELRAQVIAASALPEKSGKYSVRVEWSGVKTQSSEVSTKNGCIKWFETLRRKTTVVPKGCEEVLPDVFVYLMYGHEKISFLRIPVKDCGKKDTSTYWKQLIPDRTCKKVVENWNAGFLKVRVYVGKLDKELNVFDKKNWGKIAHPDLEVWNLYIHAFQCRDLPSADSNGLADPYLKIYCAGKEVPEGKNYQENTVNPRWYETYHMKLEVPSIKDSDPIVVYVYDYDKLSSDDILGVTFIDMAEAVVEPEGFPRPVWYDLSLAKRGTEKGKVLISFSLFRDEVKEDFKIAPEFEDKTVQINILGLRDLKPALGWLPVNKAFIKFDLNSLTLPGESVGLKSVETQPFEPGSDPNINSTVSFKVKMPKDPIYSPYLTATVHDCLFHGLSQPLIGSFCINLGNYNCRYVGRAILCVGLTYQRLKTNKNLFKRMKTVREENSKKVKVLEKIDEIKEEQTEDRRYWEDITDEAKGLLDENRFNELEHKEQMVRIGHMTLEELCMNKNFIKRKAVYKKKKKGQRIEINIPDHDKYIELGFNSTARDETKYYRYFINDPLEKTYIFDKLPFEELDIFKGQERGDDSLFNFGQSESDESHVKKVGKLKFLLRMSDYPAPEPDPDDEFFKISKKLLIKARCVIRVYIIDAYDLEQKDKFSKSDPYVSIKLGKSKFSDRDNHEDDTDRIEIYKCFELHANLPGKSMLKVQLWDYNLITSDSKIGTTRIDLEDRFFNEKWLELEEKPIETRPLFLKSCGRPQGFVRLWVEILEGTSVKERDDISLRPPGEFEARVIVWRAVEVPAMDIEDVSDVYVSVSINDSVSKETDTHLRSGSSPSWNWRMKFPLTISSKTRSSILKLQLWDRDFLSSNDFISEGKVDFSEIAKKSWESNCAMQQLGQSDNFADLIKNKLSNIFWVQCKHMNSKGKEENRGKVLVSLELVPKSKADAMPVGEGRSEPNMNPKLPEPSGRIRLSLNPIKTICQTIGNGARCCVCVICTFSCMVILACFMIPVLLANAIIHI